MALILIQLTICLMLLSEREKETMHLALNHIQSDYLVWTSSSDGSTHLELLGDSLTKIILYAFTPITSLDGMKTSFNNFWMVAMVMWTTKLTFGPVLFTREMTKSS